MEGVIRLTCIQRLVHIRWNHCSIFTLSFLHSWICTPWFLYLLQLLSLQLLISTHNSENIQQQLLFHWIRYKFSVSFSHSNKFWFLMYLFFCLNCVKHFYNKLFIQTDLNWNKFKTAYKHVMSYLYTLSQALIQNLLVY